MIDPFTLLQLADIYQKKAAETLDQSDLAHARRYRECAEEIVQLQQILNEELRRRYALQEKLDEVMREYCPEEMTEAQIENWAKHQRQSD